MLQRSIVAAEKKRRERGRERKRERERERVLGGVFWC